MGYNTGSLSGSFASGAVTGSSGAVRVGGLVGSVFSGGTISDSYATGAVSGGTFRGGLVGQINSTTRYSISNTYATGVVSSSGATNYGGLIGSVVATSVGSVSNSFWNSDNTSSAGFGSAGKGLSSAAMKTASNFSAWSISSAGGSSSTWRIYDGSTSPLLRTFLTALATDTRTTYNGAVQFGTGYGLSNVFGTVASGTNAGTYTGGTLYSNQKGYDLSGSGTLTIAKAPLTITGSSASTTYTGVAQTVSGYTVSGLVGSDTTSSLSGVSASVSGTNAGSYTNSVTASTQTNYTVSTANGSLTIAKAALTVSGTTASSKTYDGNTSAAINVGTLGGLVNSETVTATASGTFDSQNAGSRTATATYTLVSGSGLASNYSLADTTHSASINKKALTYTSDAASFRTGTPLTGLTGKLSGFVNQETQSTATTGTLAWVTPATSASGGGSYAINGSGLLANNYSFSQAEGNAAALTLTQTTSFVPVLSTTPLLIDTSFKPKAMLTLPNNKFTELTDTAPLSERQLFYLQGNGINLPNGYYQATPTNLE